MQSCCASLSRFPSVRSFIVLFVRNKSVCCCLITAGLGDHTDHRPSLLHIMQPQSWLTFSNFDCYGCVTTLLCGTKAHQRWVGLDPLCCLDPFKNHTARPEEVCQDLNCFVKEPKGAFKSALMEL